MTKGTRNPISISIAPAMHVAGKHYYDLRGATELMKQLWRESVLDGFEFQNLAEWDTTHPPRDDAETRLEAWNDSQKYTVDQMAGVLRATGLPVLSVHANRDVGVCLCTGDEQDISRARTLIDESLSLAEQVGAAVCVFHLWDTRKEDFDPGLLQRVLSEVAAGHPGVRPSVENVPTNLAGVSPFDLARQYECITLDLQWAALYDELDRFAEVKERLVNVHLRGRLAGGEWMLEDAPFSLRQALHAIRERWGYGGLTTVEPKGLRAGDWQGLVAALASLRDALSN